MKYKIAYINEHGIECAFTFAWAQELDMIVRERLHSGWGKERIRITVYEVP